MKYTIELDAADVAMMRAALRQLLTVAMAQTKDNHTAIGRRMWTDTAADCLRLETMIAESTLLKSKDVPQ